MAFYILDPTTQKRYNLQDIDGIPIRPGGKLLNTGEKLQFRLIFDRVPADRFHLLEGTLPEPGRTTWSFMNVRLEK